MTNDDNTADCYSLAATEPFSPRPTIHQSGPSAIHTRDGGEVLYMGSGTYECQTCHWQTSTVPKGVEPRRFVWRADND